MDLYTRDTSVTVSLKDTGESSQTETTMRASGSLAKLTAMEFTLTKTALHTKATGLKMTRTVKAKNNGLMDLSTKVIMLKARKKAKESLLGLMEASMTETLRGICQMAQVSTLGLTEDDMKEAGKSQRCMVMESTHGQMGESMMASM